MILLLNENQEVSKAYTSCRGAKLGQITYIIRLKLPQTPGSYMLCTYAVNTDASKTLCRRKIKVVN
jgi:hypothetical protein